METGPHQEEVEDSKILVITRKLGWNLVPSMSIVIRICKVGNSRNGDHHSGCNFLESSFFGVPYFSFNSNPRMSLLIVSREVV